MNFSELGLKENIVRALNFEKIYTPAKIQESAIPQLLGGVNAVLCSETGSGKTFAYLLPVYEKQEDTIKKELQCLIVVPTHELAMQIAGEAKKLSEHSGIDIKCEPIIGGVNISRQIEKLKEKPQIIVGTPKRILELIKRKKITSHTVKTAVFDEADKLLEDSNIEIIKAIRKTMLRDTQTIFVSAAIDDDDISKINDIVENVTILKGNEPKIPENIEHIEIVCEPRKKINELRKIASIYKDKKIIVFINRTSDNETACEKLLFHGYNAGCINGATGKEERKKAISSFKEGKINILIATDIAARGIHINDIEAVVNVSISEDPNDYIHRAGRCGRNGKKGTSILLVTERERGMLKKYESRLNIKITPKFLIEGKFSNAVKRTRKRHNALSKETMKNKISRTAEKKPFEFGKKAAKLPNKKLHNENYKNNNKKFDSRKFKKREYK